jgi:hypothetical protein
MRSRLCRWIDKLGKYGVAVALSREYRSAGGMDNARNGAKRARFRQAEPTRRPEMDTNRDRRRFLVAMTCAAAFIVATSMVLPDRVAAHFAAGGAANGFLPRAAYIAFMLLVVVGLPTLMVLSTSAALARPGARINLPNADFWLAPERRQQTIAAIAAGMRQFGLLFVAFLCYAHVLVVRANRGPAIHLDEPAFYAGLAGFLLIVLWWVRAFLRRFRVRG